ncbi:hypothetical protein [Escherichia coli]
MKFSIVRLDQRDELAPAMKAAIAQHGELELKPLMAQALCIWG